MNKKKNFLVIFIVAILIVLLLIFSNKNRKKLKNTEQTDTFGVTLNEANELERAIFTSIQKCYQKYKDSGANIEDFWQYFDSNSMNREFGEGFILGVGNEYGIDVNMVEKYNLKGEKISEFPTEYEDGSKIEFEKNKTKIEPDKYYMIKVYSNEDYFVHYYIIKISQNGDLTLRPICYTFGEVINFDSSDAL